MRHTRNPPPTQNIPPFLTSTCDRLRLYPPPFKHLYATLTKSTLRRKIYPHFKHPRPSQNLPVPPSLPATIGYPPILTTICDTPIIHPSPPEYTPFYIKWRSQNMSLPSRIYSLVLQLYATLKESIPPSENLPRPPTIYLPYSTAADTKKEPYLWSYLNRRYNICPHV